MRFRVACLLVLVVGLLWSFAYAAPPVTFHFTYQRTPGELEKLRVGGFNKLLEYAPDTTVGEQFSDDFFAAAVQVAKLRVANAVVVPFIIAPASNDDGNDDLEGFTIPIPGNDLILILDVGNFAQMQIVANHEGDHVLLDALHVPQGCHGKLHHQIIAMVDLSGIPVADLLGGPKCDEDL